MATKSTKSTKKGKPHPQHLAREIRSMFTGEFTAWSIYPDQIAAMYLRLQRDFAFQIAIRCPGLPGKTITGLSAELGRQTLRSLGLVTSEVRPARKL